MSEEPRRPRARKSVARRLGDELSRGGALARTDTGAEIQALDRLNAEMDADDEARPSLVSRIPGWLIVAVLVAAFVMGVFFMQWAE